MGTLLDLRGPEFLQLYLYLLAIAVAAALIIRSRCRVPSPTPWSDEIALDSYQVAYLSGGARLAVNAALASLVQQGILAADTVGRKLVILKRSGQCAHALEKRVLGAVGAVGGDLGMLHRRDPELAEPFDTELVEADLLCSDGMASRARWGSILPMALMLILGCLKISVGMQRQRPVGFLAALCFATAVVTLVLLCKVPFRSRLGDTLLRRLKKENVALLETVRSLQGQRELSGQDVSLAVGLFGAAVMSAGPLSDLRIVLGPPPGSGGCGGGGGGGGGGCGGGGCGGCGG
jgi:uncharacterized protein (TIGR04222 family)